MYGKAASGGSDKCGGISVASRIAAAALVPRAATRRAALAVKSVPTVRTLIFSATEDGRTATVR